MEKQGHNMGKIYFNYDLYRYENRRNCRIEKGKCRFTGGIHGGNKTRKGKNRSIPIHKDIVEIIKELYENSPTDYLIYNDKWIFSKKKNENKPLRKNYFREKFYKTLETLKINKHKTHDCRKTLATLMSNQKINNIVITDIMGHENIATTKQYYIQTDKQKLKLSMNSLNFRKTS